MKAKTQKKIPTSIPVLVIGIVLLLSLTLAGIYMASESAQRLFSLSNFNATCEVVFDGVDDMNAYTGERGVLVSLNASDANYIGNLRVGVGYSGSGVGLIRVRVLDEWSVTKDGVRTVMPHMPVPFTLSNRYSETAQGNAKSWYDNRVSDDCFYYATPVYVSGTNSETIPLITGLDESHFDAGAVPSETELHIIVEADVVQVNRYPQYWGLRALPWTEGLSSAEENLT